MATATGGEQMRGTVQRPVLGGGHRTVEVASPDARDGHVVEVSGLVERVE
jgi:hypothetical protein